ncbi:MAG: glycosyltransferase family 4 protein, partial [bacterium]|nr:glycosyltransferase family 4 protein [bacterium]
MKNKKESGKTELLVCCQLFYPELISTGLTLTELCESLSDAGVDIEVLCAPPTIMDRKSDVPETIIYKGITIKRVWSTRFPKLNITGKLTNHITYTLSILLHLIKCPEKPVLVLTNPPLLAPFIALILKIK